MFTPKPRLAEQLMSKLRPKPDTAYHLPVKLYLFLPLPDKNFASLGRGIAPRISRTTYVKN